MNRISNWMEQMYHRLHGHLLVTVLTEDGEEYSFYLSSVFAENGRWTMDFAERASPVNLPDGNLKITITGA